MYNYLEAVKNDVLQYIGENIEKGEYTKEDLEEKLNNWLWVEDSVTGNASGSYFCSSYKAFECLFGNEDLIYDAKDELVLDESKLYDWEYLDVSIRCFVLSEAIGEAIEELEEEGFFKAEKELI